jgi:hypothetical protein
MACNFSLDLSGPPSQALERARTEIEKQGGTFNGDENSGSFTVKIFGTISGSYTVSGGKLNVVISDKPMFISCGQIESFLRSHVS